jgi:hypothetical protein
METTVYTRYIGTAPSFDGSLNLLRDILSERLLPNFRKIWVDGSNAGKVKLCFTIFNDYEYDMKFFDTKTFRHFRGNSENIDAEIAMFQLFAENAISEVLSDFVN